MSCYRCPVERSASAFGVCLCLCVRVQVQRVPLPHRHLLKGGSSRNQESVFLPYGNEEGAQYVVNVYRLRDTAVQLLC